jgi:hypothetical protein
MKKCSDDAPSHVSLEERAGRRCMPPQQFFGFRYSLSLLVKNWAGDEDDPVGVGRLIFSLERCFSSASSCLTLRLSDSISSEAWVRVDAFGAPLLLQIRSFATQFEHGVLLSHFVRRRRQPSHALATWARFWRRCGAVGRSSPVDVREWAVIATQDYHSTCEAKSNMKKTDVI